jgi:hypothetical protein
MVIGYHEAIDDYAADDAPSMIESRDRHAADSSSLLKGEDIENSISLPLLTPRFSVCRAQPKQVCRFASTFNMGVRYWDKNMPAVALLEVYDTEQIVLYVVQESILRAAISRTANYVRRSQPRSSAARVS